MARENFIGGAWVPARSGATDAVVAPGDRRRCSTRWRRATRPTSTPRSTAAAARSPTGRRARPRERSEVLQKVADAIEADIGPAQRARGRATSASRSSIIEFEMDLTVDNCASSPAARASSRAGPRASTSRSTRRSCAATRSASVASIAPWNYPLNMATWKVGPALAAGNTVVLKPSELTPLTALRLAEITADILPPGVLNVVTGQGETAGAALGRATRRSRWSRSPATSPPASSSPAPPPTRSSASTSSSAARRR